MQPLFRNGPVSSPRAPTMGGHIHLIHFPSSPTLSDPVSRIFNLFAALSHPTSAPRDPALGGWRN
jgi:hypothetical protein